MKTKFVKLYSTHIRHGKGEHNKNWSSNTGKRDKICKHKVFSFACSMSVLYVIKGCGYMEAIPTLLIDFHSLLTVSTVDWLGHK